MVPGFLTRWRLPCSFSTCLTWIKLPLVSRTWTQSVKEIKMFFNTPMCVSIGTPNDVRFQEKIKSHLGEISRKTRIIWKEEKNAEMYVIRRVSRHWLIDWGWVLKVKVRRETIKVGIIRRHCQSAVFNLLCWMDSICTSLYCEEMKFEVSRAAGDCSTWIWILIDGPKWKPIVEKIHLALYLALRLLELHNEPKQ